MGFETLIAEKNVVLARHEKLKEKENALKAKKNDLFASGIIDTVVAEIDAIKKDIKECEQRYEEKIKEIGSSNQMMEHMFEMFDIKDANSTEDSNLDTSSASIASNERPLNSSLESSFNLASVSIENLLIKAEKLTYTKSTQKNDSSSDEIVITIDQKKIQENLNGDKGVSGGDKAGDHSIESVLSADDVVDENNALNKTPIRGDVLNSLFNVVEENDQGKDEKQEVNSADNGENNKAMKRRRSSKPKQ